MAKKEEIKPILTPNKAVLQPIVSISQDEANADGVLIAQQDKDGNEIPNTEFTASLREWERTYSKSTKFKFFIKKK